MRLLSGWIGLAGGACWLPALAQIGAAAALDAAPFPPGITRVALRWRPGIVQIGAPNIAVSKGPYILQSTRNGETSWRVGFYQTVWLRGGSDGGP